MTIHQESQDKERNFLDRAGTIVEYYIQNPLRAKYNGDYLFSLLKEAYASTSSDSEILSIELARIIQEHIIIPNEKSKSKLERQSTC